MTATLVRYIKMSKSESTKRVVQDFEERRAVDKASPMVERTEKLWNFTWNVPESCVVRVAACLKCDERILFIAGPLRDLALIAELLSAALKEVNQ